ncbi:hypothetical protein HBZS_105010 [Helicobacter bizzozeronii CCUG 35545]|nr:hypothetical protein HBZS_105010 [Helicobacter bizzozeronii CCUG 35545]
MSSRFNSNFCARKHNSPSSLLKPSCCLELGFCSKRLLICSAGVSWGSGGVKPKCWHREASDSVTSSIWLRRL